jgi:hypothetical protein
MARPLDSARMVVATSLADSSVSPSGYPLDLGRDELAEAPPLLQELFPDGGVAPGAHPELEEQDVPVVIAG